MRVTPSVHIFECLGRTVGGIWKCGLFRGMSTGVGFKVSKVHDVRTLLVHALSLLVSLCLPASPSSAPAVNQMYCTAVPATTLFLTMMVIDSPQ